MYFDSRLHISSSPANARLRMSFNTVFIENVDSVLRNSASLDLFLNGFTTSHDCAKGLLPIKKLGSNLSSNFCGLEFLCLSLLSIS